MDTYTVLRHFADSWVLLAMFLLFVGICIRVFLPRYRGSHEEAATSVFRNESAPAPTPKEAKDER